MELINELGLLVTFGLWLCPATFITWYIMKIPNNNQTGRLQKIVLIGILFIIVFITIVSLLFMIYHQFFNQWKGV